jgi:hypothetical protein
VRRARTLSEVGSLESALCCSGTCHATDVLDVRDVWPVSEDAGESTDSRTGSDGFFLIFLARMVSIFLVKTVRGMFGSSRTMAEKKRSAFMSINFGVASTC